jgi:hypothetical protein
MWFEYTENYHARRFSSFFASSTDITLELLDEKCMVFELF